MKNSIIKEVKKAEAQVSEEKELTEKQLDKVTGGLKAAPTVVEVDPKGGKDSL